MNFYNESINAIKPNIINIINLNFKLVDHLKMLNKYSYQEHPKYTINKKQLKIIKFL